MGTQVEGKRTTPVLIKTNILFRNVLGFTMSGGNPQGSEVDFHDILAGVVPRLPVCVNHLGPGENAVPRPSRRPLQSVIDGNFSSCSWRFFFLSHLSPCAAIKLWFLRETPQNLASYLKSTGSHSNFCRIQKHGGDYLCLQGRHRAFPSWQKVLFCASPSDEMRARATSQQLFWSLCQGPERHMSKGQIPPDRTATEPCG